jgi:hypothetical protein
VKTFPKPEEVDKILGWAGNWLRFDAWSWLIATERPAHEVNAALRTVLAPEDSILIIRCDPNDYSGFAQQWVWDWIDGYRDRPSNALSAGLAGGYVRGALAPDSPLTAGWKPEK